MAKGTTRSELTCGRMCGNVHVWTDGNARRRTPAQGEGPGLLWTTKDARTPLCSPGIPSTDVDRDGRTEPGTLDLRHPGEKNGAIRTDFKVREESRCVNVLLR